MIFMFKPSSSDDVFLPSTVVGCVLRRPGATSRMPATFDRTREWGFFETGDFLEWGLWIMALGYRTVSRELGSSLVFDESEDSKMVSEKTNVVIKVALVNGIRFL